jgi:hypothetical protein
MAIFLELKCAQCGAEAIVEAETAEDNGTGSRFTAEAPDDLCEHAEEPDAQFYVRVNTFEEG